MPAAPASTCCIAGCWSTVPQGLLAFCSSCEFGMHVEASAGLEMYSMQSSFPQATVDSGASLPCPGALIVEHCGTSSNRHVAQRRWSCMVLHCGHSAALSCSCDPLRRHDTVLLTTADLLCCLSWSRGQRLASAHRFIAKGSTQWEAEAQWLSTSCGST